MTEDRLKGEKLTKFTRYIEKRGAELLESHNPYEIIRFKIYGDLNIIYKKGSGLLTFAGDQAETAFTSWQAGKNWTPVNRRRQNLSARKLLIAKRDGLGCFFCVTPHDSVKTLTIEHLLSFRHGGTDNINNLALACQPCNVELGSKPITEKIRIRDKHVKIYLQQKAALDSATPDPDTKKNLLTELYGN